MQPTKSKVTDKDWTSALSAMIADVGNQHPGEGWKTFSEIKKLFPNVGENRIRKLLIKQKIDGTIQVVERSIFDPVLGIKIRRVFYSIK